MEDWVSAREFRDAVQAAGEFSSILDKVCARASAGLVKTVAARVVLHTKSGPQVFDDAVLPIGFWWAKGRRPMNVCWTSGDFSCQFSEEKSRWDSKAINLLAAPPSGLAAMLVEAFNVRFERSVAAELCPSLAPPPEPIGKPLSEADAVKLFAALQSVRSNWTEADAKAAADVLFPGRHISRNRLRAGLKTAGLNQVGPGRPKKAPKDGSAE